MCGRFTLTVNANTIQQVFPWLEIPPDSISARYNIAPSQPIPVIPNTGENKLDYFIWGLIPFWAKDSKIGSRMINARSETLEEKPSFRTPFRHKRCLILADGFYEWASVANQKRKIPHYIQLESKMPFAFAGLWEEWNASDGSLLRTAAIITTDSNPIIAPIHNRMPVILPIKTHDIWLDSKITNPDDLKPLLKPFTEKKMVKFPVSNLVNNPSNDLPNCILPI